MTELINKDPMGLLSEMIKVVLIGTMLYVGHSVTALNTTVSALQSDAKGIKERLDKLDNSVVTRIEYLTGQELLKERIDGIKTYKIQSK